MSIDLTKRAVRRTAKLENGTWKSLHNVIRNHAAFIDKTPGGHRYKISPARLSSVLPLLKELPEGTYSLGKGRDSDFTHRVLLFIDHN